MAEDILRDRNWRIALGTILGIILVLSAILLVRTAVAGRATKGFSESINQADRAMSEGGGSDARSSLRESERFARTAADYLSLYRRALSLAGGDPGDALCEEIIFRATRALPGNQSLRAIEVWSLMRTRSTAMAAGLAGKYLTDPEYASFRVEAELRDAAENPAPTSRAPTGTSGGARPRSGSSAAAKTEPPASGAAGGTAHSQPDAELFATLTRDSSPDLYRRAASVTGDSRFLLDMTLLRARESVRTAYRDIQGTEIPTEYPGVAGTLAYDAGDFAGAESYIRSIEPAQSTPRQAPAPAETSAFSLDLLLADIAMVQGDYREALKWYTTLETATPASSPVIYINLAWLAGRGLTAAGTDGDESATGNFPAAASPGTGAKGAAGAGSSPGIIASSPGINTSSPGIDFLKAGYARFTDNPLMVRAYAEALRRGGDSTQGRKVVDAYLADHSSDASMALYRLMAFGGAANSVRTIASLWELSNRFPGSGEIADALAGRLFAVRDYGSLQELIDRYTDSPDGALPGHLDYYTAIKQAVSGNSENAADSFARIFHDRAEWQAAYDRGLTAIATGSFGPARADLNDARAAYLGHDALQGDWGASNRGTAATGGIEGASGDAAKLFYFLAEAELAGGQVDSAAQNAQRAVSMDPNLVNAVLLLDRLKAAGYDSKGAVVAPPER